MPPDQLSQSPFSASRLADRAALGEPAEKMASRDAGDADLDAAALALSNVFELGDLWRGFLEGLS